MSATIMRHCASVKHKIRILLAGLACRDVALCETGETRYKLAA
ncbi:MAG: hypothetical protein AAF280_00890 [Pseudomonadota bacterium]